MSSELLRTDKQPLAQIHTTPGMLRFERAASLRQKPLSRDVRSWLRCLADPEARAPIPSKPLPSADLPKLFDAALHHLVLPIVHRRLSSGKKPGGATQQSDISDQLAALAARSLILMHQSERVAAAFTAAGVEAVLVKGPVFARRLYRDPVLRPFSDIDFLAHPGAKPKSRELMQELGFVLFEDAKRAGRDYHEDQWCLSGRNDILVEIQDNLVHSPSLQDASLTYGDLLDVGDGDPHSATGLLLIAAVHGAIGHQFEYLRFVVDVCQAGRGLAGPIDVHQLEKVSSRNGTKLAIVTALDLAARVFFDQACRDLADRLGRARGRGLCRFLLSPNTVLRAQSTTRRRDSWRRKAVREVFKRNLRAAGRAQASPSTHPRP